MKFLSYFFLVLFVSILVVFAGKKPNIIFLLADDHRADTIGAHGNPHIQTPNLDRLSEEGVSFLRNYCAGSFSGAVCVASRAMLMTGHHWKTIKQKPKNWGAHPLLPARLAEKGGYRTFIVGKWHNGLGTLRRAFSSGKSVYMGGMCDHTSFQVQDLTDGKLSEKRNAGAFSSTVFADAAIDFVKNTKTDRPFFLYVAFTAPHDPRNPPEKFRQIYYDKRPPLPKNYLPQHPFKNGPQAMMGRDEGLAAWPRAKEVISDQLCEYYGLVTHLDEQVGRIMKAVQNSPHANNTYLIYTADHGLAMGSHGLLGKQNVYEQSMACPLIIGGPGIPAGHTNKSFTYVHDLHATVYAMADVKAPKGIDAKDLTPLWQGKSQSVRDSVFLPFQNNQRAINDGRWKLHIYPKINHRLLFDIQSDPHETNNLANDPKYKAEIKRLEQLMATWRTRLGDNDPLQFDNPEPKEARYDNAKRTLDVWQPKWIRDKYFGGRNDPNHGPISKSK